MKQNKMNNQNGINIFKNNNPQRMNIMLFNNRFSVNNPQNQFMNHI